LADVQEEPKSPVSSVLIQEILMRNKIGRAFVFAAFIAGLAGAPLLVASAADSPADIIKTRQDGLKKMGLAFKNVNDELKTDSPKLAVIQESAKVFQQTAKEIKGWFPAGSGPESGVKTKAKAEIWSQAADFAAARDKLATEADAFAQTAASGDIDKIKAQVRPMGGACGNCHRTFREKDTAGG
jgi:cytochrome c556